MIDAATISDTGVSAPVFLRVGELNTRLNTASSIVESYVRENIGRNWRRFHHAVDYDAGVARPPLAIIAGGPSLLATLDEARKFSDTMVCGSAHDFVVKAGISPTYTVHSDSQSITVGYMTERCGARYLLASSCDPIVFENAPADQVEMWHNFGGVDGALFQGEPAVNGGCTVTLRAINLAILLGYSDLHFFGLDSSYAEDGTQHAYKGEVLGTIPIRVGGPDGREFMSSPAMLAQASHFQEMYGKLGNLFTPTVHGDGMIAEIMRQGHNEAMKQGAAA